jgi:hypothetical protein
MGPDATARVRVLHLTEDRSEDVAAHGLAIARDVEGQSGHSGAEVQCGATPCAAHS